MFFIHLVRNLLVFGVIIGIIQIWLSRKSYVFDTTNLSAIAKRYSMPTTASGSATVNEIRDGFKGVVKELRQFYGPFILPDVDLKWVKISHGGGGAIAICPIHLSLSEYIILVGTAVPSTAHCGRSWTNTTLIPIAGSADVWSERYTATTYTPGQAVTLNSGETCIIHYKPGFWALEYSRGFLPSVLPHLFGGFFFLNQDPWLIYHIADAFFKSQLQQFEFALLNWREVLKF